MRTPCVRHCRAGQPWLFRLLKIVVCLLEPYVTLARLVRRCAFGQEGSLADAKC